jgi:hypothetical protein
MIGFSTSFSLVPEANLNQTGEMEGGAQFDCGRQGVRLNMSFRQEPRGRRSTFRLVGTCPLDSRPRGVTLDRLTCMTPKGSYETETVLFASSAGAFNLAQQKYPKRVQYGASSETSWKNVGDLGLVHPAHDEKIPGSGVTVQYRAGRVHSR